MPKNLVSAKTERYKEMTMKHEPGRLFLLVVLLSLIDFGCFPSKEATSIHKEMITSLQTKVTSPTKVVLRDASVLLFPLGITVYNDTIIGVGQRFWLSGSSTRNELTVVPFDSIAAMTKYESKSSGASAVASFLHGLLGGVTTPLSLYCLACPKCCFGSCPTVYTYDGTRQNLEAELFSHCISRQLEEQDVDFFNQPLPDSGLYQLSLKNEALETHYLNYVAFYLVHHPVGTRIYPSEDGTPVAIQTHVQPARVTNRSGDDILRAVRQIDSIAYRSGEGMVVRMMGGDPFDWLDVKLEVPESVRTIRMIVRLRNTLLSTILLYDVVMASQGIEAMNWTTRMDTDPVYASQFRAIYNAFSGVAVKVLRNGQWVQQTTVKDVGPLAWKTFAVQIPVDRAGELSLRLQFVSDNFMIDMIGFDVSGSSQPPLFVEKIDPKEIQDNSGRLRRELALLIEKDDDQYLVTNPGESYRLSYDVRKKAGYEATAFVRSKGYYTEWIRGSWLRNPQSAYQFNLFQTEQIFSRLAESWLENKDAIEKRFFDARIPVKEIP